MLPVVPFRQASAPLLVGHIRPAEVPASNLLAASLKTPTLPKVAKRLPALITNRLQIVFAPEDQNGQVASRVRKFDFLKQIEAAVAAPCNQHGAFSLRSRYQVAVKPSAETAHGPLSRRQNTIQVVNVVKRGVTGKAVIH